MLIIGPLLIALARIARSSWVNVPLDAGDLPQHPIPNLALAASLVLALAAPALLLPVGSMRGATREGDDLVAPTVLGRRRVATGTLTRVGGFTVWGRGFDTQVIWLRDASGRHLIFARARSQVIPRWVEAKILELHARDDHAVSARVRLWFGLAPRPSFLHRVALALVTMAAFVGYVVLAIIAAGILGMVAGIWL